MARTQTNIWEVNYNIDFDANATGFSSIYSCIGNIVNGKYALNDEKTVVLKTGGGCFVNMASITGVVGSPGQVAYSSTKGAVITITKSAAKELAPMNIRVNAVAPGIVKTERFEELYEATGDKINERIGRIALGRLGTPQDIANAVSL